MEFQTECLNAHNDYRQKHGVPPLELSEKICEVAQKWADVLAKKKKLIHSDTKEYGENLYFKSSPNEDTPITGEEVVEYWYKEIDAYIFAEEPKNTLAFHFTQVVWKDSKEIGVGIAKNKGKVYVVANYSPAGNVMGNFTKNVPPVGGF